MSTDSERMAGWFKRKSDQEADEAESQSASTTTGGGIDREPVVVWEAANLMEAQIVVGRLASEGIPAIIRGEALGPIYGLTTGGLAAAAVLVPAPLVEQALALLQDEVEWEDDEPPEDKGD